MSVISEGEALGHDVWIDAKTLRQVKNTASTYAGGLKVKMNHYSGVESIVGTLQNFRIKESKLLADLHLLQNADSYARILEMAEKMPESFGLSIVFDNDPELIEKVNYARCKEIYSADLVDNPAANPSGLFEQKQKSNTMNKDILQALKLPETATQAEYDAAIIELAKKNDHDGDEVKYEKDGKTHSKDCMCASCSKMKKMSEIITPEFLTELKAKLGEGNTELAKKVEGIEKANANAVALSKKAEIDNLMAEAGRNGQVVPLENDDLYTVKDGVCTINTEPEKLRKMLSKLPKSQIQLARGFKPAPPKDEEGKEIFDRHTPEGRAKVIQFCRQQQMQNATLLGAEIKSANRQFFPETN
ncbi:MAG: hypothetical protein KGL39_10135 [Patescibacteria group bacterium]|nr:hypothetical protein [Patescibacteria group bacterium]